MSDPKEIRSAIASAGKLQELVDRVLVYGVVPRWLPLQVACFYGGIAEKKMLDHVEGGDIYGKLDGGKWLIDRLSIDEFNLQEKKKKEIILEKISSKI